MDGSQGCTLTASGGFVTRWRQAGDIDAFVDIDTHSEEYMWVRDDFHALFREKNIGCFVVTNFGQVAGYIIFEEGRERFYVLNLSVHPDYRRQDVAGRLLRKLKSKLTDDKREIRCDVRESNLAAHLLLRKNGFRAEKILYDYFMDYYSDDVNEEPTKEHAYSFYFYGAGVKTIKNKLCVV